MTRSVVGDQTRHQCHLVFSSLVSSSRCLDPTCSVTTLPPSPHRLVGKLLVGSCLCTILPPPSTLTMSPGSHHVVAMQQLLSLVTAYSRLPLLPLAYCCLIIAISSWLATTMCWCGRFTPMLSPHPLLAHPFPLSAFPLRWPKWFCDIHIILERF
jgi:hypothetical protein